MLLAGNSERLQGISIYRNCGYLELLGQHNGRWLKCVWVTERGRWNSRRAVLKTSRLNHFDGQFVSHDGKEAVLLGLVGTKKRSNSL